MRNFLWSPRHEELFDKAFPNQSWRVIKQLAGYSGAYVYQLMFNNNPVIVKIAHPAVIEREWISYQTHVVDTLRDHVPHLSEICESDDGQEALLRYTYAGITNSNTLFEFVQEQGHSAITTVQSILRNMFAHGGSNRPRSWWGKPPSTAIMCADYYDRWLPVYLELQWLPGQIDDAILLDADHVFRDHVAGLAPGQIVQLQGFKLEKEEDQVVTLFIGRPQSPSFRVKLTGIGVNFKADSEPIYASIRETRKTLFEKYGETAIPGFSIRNNQFTWNGYDYVNPLYYLDQLLGTHYDAIISTIHGDFNLRNILIEEKKPHHESWTAKLLDQLQRSKHYDWWLIDFASTQSGPVLLDLQWLEAQVINWLLIPALQQAGHGPHALRHILTTLYQGRPLPWRFRSQGLTTPYALLLEIRRLAEGYLAEPVQNKERWQEYYRGLTLALLSTLKHEALSQALGEQVKTYAMIGAATTVGWSGVVKQKAPSFWPSLPVANRLNLAIATSVIVLLLAVTIIYPLADKFRIFSQLVQESDPSESSVTESEPASQFTPCDDTLTPIRIGVAINESPPYGIFGQDQRIGALMAEGYFNQQGGIHGRCIDVDIRDLKSNTRRMHDSGRQFIEGVFNSLIEEDAVAIIGPGLSEQVGLIEEYLKAITTTVIGPSTTKPGIICDNEFFMRISAPGKWYIGGALDEVYTQLDKFRANVAIAYADDDDFTVGEFGLLKEYIEDHASAYNLIDSMPYQINNEEIDVDSSLVNVAETLVQMEPDLVLIAGLTIDGRKLIYELRTQGYMNPIFGGNGLNTPYLFDKCKGDCNVFDNFYMPMAYNNTDDETEIKAGLITSYQEFDQRQKAKPEHDPNPGQFTAQLFSGVQIVVDALRAMEPINDDELQQPKIAELRSRLNKTLHGMEQFETPFGKIRFTEEGEIIQHEFYLAMAQKNPKTQGYMFTIIDAIPSEGVEEAAIDACGIEAEK